jgi:predicted Rossmann fold flavoprotein
MGVSVASAELKIAGTALRQSGPLLITHWGLSGPAALKLSAWGARQFKEMNYNATLLINWTTLPDEDSVRQAIRARASELPRRTVENDPMLHLPARLWQRLCELAGISPGKIWSELARKDKNRLVENLYHFSIAMKGKTTFKEEFVTCGGVDLPGVNLATMEHKKIPGLYFAGEVLDIDGETGGFNFQAAWTTGWVAGSSIAARQR